MAKRVAQIVTATGFVNAVVRPSGPLVAPTGMTFLEIEDHQPDVCGWTWDGENFIPPPAPE